jgi:hypothetical protein
MSGLWSLTVTAPAADYQLLSAEELRVAAGIDPDDTSQDAALAIRGLQVAEALANACGIAKAGYDVTLAPLRGEAPITLKAETLVQRFRILNGYQGDKLLLARWPALEVLSVTTDTTALTVDDWVLDIPGSALLRVSDNGTLCWPAGRVIVEYDAGYDVIPEGLKGYASRLVSLYHSTTGADMSERRVEIPGVITVERWVDTAATDILVPEDIMTGLERDGYRRVLAW